MFKKGFVLFRARSAIDVSSDGSKLVYSAPKGLYTIPVDELDDKSEAKIIPGSDENAHFPFFSPESKRVAYIADNQLKTIAIEGGTPKIIAEASPLDIEWAMDGTILFNRGGSIMRISADGGNPEELVKPNYENGVLNSPQMLPGGNAVLFTRIRPRPMMVMVQLLDSGERKELVEGDTARYLPTGDIVFRKGTALYTVPFDLNELEVIGDEPVVRIDGVFADPAPQFAVSGSGTLAYMPRSLRGVKAPVSTVVWVDRDQNVEPLISEPGVYSNLKISPDGNQVALTIGASTDNPDIWIMDLGRPGRKKFTSNRREDLFPLWTPDSQWILFTSSRDGMPKLYRKRVDIQGQAELLDPDYGEAVWPLPSSWSRNGKTLVFSDFADIKALLLEGEPKIKTLLKEKCDETEPKVSPDGKWMAYTSCESDGYGIYVCPYPETNKGEFIGKGNSPLWSRDGRELFYRNGVAVMAVSVTTEATFSFAASQELFQGTYVSVKDIPADDDGTIKYLHYLNTWDVSPDGRFLMLKKADATSKTPRQIIVLENWSESLKQRAPRQ